jgi:hypothetical protein
MAQMGDVPAPVLMVLKGLYAGVDACSRMSLAIRVPPETVTRSQMSRWPAIIAQPPIWQ